MPRDLLLQRVHPEDKALANALVTAAQTSLTAQSADYRIVLADHSERMVNERVEIQTLAHDEYQLIGIIQDITERKQAEQRIHFLAYYDPLTRLPNRQTTLETLQSVLPVAHQQGQAVALLFLDLDLFRRINETFGHETGDHLLCLIANRLTACIEQLPQSNLVFSRQGGDEFTLIVPNSSLAQAEHIAQGLLNCLEQPFQLEAPAMQLFITPSIGISLSPLDGEWPDTLLKNAETAMYRAKLEGRNNYRVYNRTMNATAYQRLTLENQLRRALDKQEFTLYYQPQIELKSRTILGLEALLRWHNPAMGAVSPAEFSNSQYGKNGLN